MLSVPPTGRPESSDADCALAGSVCWGLHPFGTCMSKTGFKVLIIDYEPRGIKQLSEALKGDNFEITLAKDGLSGLEVFNELQPDLVVIEAMLPKRHGFEVCEEIKGTEFGRTIPVIVVSSVYKGRKYRSLAIHHHGADEFLEKPVDPDQLLDTVERLLAGRSPRPLTAAAVPEAKPTAIPVAPAPSAAPALSAAPATATPKQNVRAIPLSAPAAEPMPIPVAPPPSAAPAPTPPGQATKSIPLSTPAAEPMPIPVAPPPSAAAPPTPPKQDAKPIPAPAPASTTPDHDSVEAEIVERLNEILGD